MHRQADAGFTLIELLVTIAIVGIVTALAVASYDFAMVKARRAAASGCLAGEAQALERYYTLHFTYVGAPAPTCPADVTDHYAVGFAGGGPTATTYVVQAVPQMIVVRRFGGALPDRSGIGDVGTSASIFTVTLELRAANVSRRLPWRLS